ncbi:unnamed protein product [Rotaria sp. Silwood1]|nr:unnamed protein product [Rotaria sp. Silwood1]
MSILVCSTLYLTSTKKSGFQPPENGQTTEEVNCVPHYDPGLFSISILSTHKGLQLKNMTNNEWVDGPLEPNIGVICADKKDELMTNGAVAFASMPGSAPITVLPGETKLEFLKRVEMAYHGLSMSKLGPSYYVLEKHTISYPTNSLKTE